MPEIKFNINIIPPIISTCDHVWEDINDDITQKCVRCYNERTISINKQ